MAYKKQLRDKDGNVVYPDVGLSLDDVVYSDDPTEVFDSVIDPNSYSTSEKWTGGYWIDGKKIYKKTFVVSIPNSGEGINVEHNISNLDLYIKYEGSIVWSNGDTTRAIPSSYIENGSFIGGYHISCQLGAKTATTFGINYGTAFRGGTAYITLYYTKTS